MNLAESGLLTLCLFLFVLLIVFVAFMRYVIVQEFKNIKRKLDALRPSPQSRVVNVSVNPPSVIVIWDSSNSGWSTYEFIDLAAAKKWVHDQLQKPEHFKTLFGIYSINVIGSTAAPVNYRAP